MLHHLYKLHSIFKNTVITAYSCIKFSCDIISRYERRRAIFFNERRYGICLSSKVWFPSKLTYALPHLRLKANNYNWKQPKLPIKDQLKISTTICKLFVLSYHYLIFYFQHSFLHLSDQPADLTALPASSYPNYNTTKSTIFTVSWGVKHSTW